MEIEGLKSGNNPHKDIYHESHHDSRPQIRDGRSRSGVRVPVPADISQASKVLRFLCVAALLSGLHQLGGWLHVFGVLKTTAVISSAFIKKTKHVGVKCNTHYHGGEVNERSCGECFLVCLTPPPSCAFFSPDLHL